MISMISIVKGKTEISRIPLVLSQFSFAADLILPLLRWERRPEGRSENGPECSSSEERASGWSGCKLGVIPRDFQSLTAIRSFSSCSMGQRDHATRHPFAAFEAGYGSCSPSILIDLGRRLSLGQPTGLETILSQYRKIRLQSRSRRGPTGRSWFW